MRPVLRRLSTAARSAVCALAIVQAGTALATPAAAGDTVVVLTGYHDDVVAPFKSAFEAAHPGITVEVLWQQGREALDTLTKPDQSGVDVFWGPAPGAFALLADRGALRARSPDRSVLPGRIGRQAISDPAGRFEAFEVAGYGLAFDTVQLRNRGLPAPGTWKDAADPRYAGLVAMPTSTNGFAAALYDIILQAEGWERGWAILSETAANVATWRSGSPSTAVAEKEAAVALTIDFYALTAATDGPPLGFVYPRTAFLPAHVAVMAKAPHPSAAATFADFLLSRPAQELLLHPDIRRHPVRPDAARAAPPTVVDPFAAPADDFLYDDALGRHRRPLNAIVFDLAIAGRHAQLAELWRSIRAAEARLAAAPRPDLAPLLAQARTLAGQVPVTTAQSTDKTFLAGFGDPSKPPDVVAGWRAELAAAHDKARALVERVDKAF